MAVKRALITGITGQDGSYLAEFLLKKGYEVYGLIRRSSSFNTGRIDHVYQDPHEKNLRLKLVYGDLNDASSLNRIIRMVAPGEIYNLGAQSHVQVSFEVPEYTAETVAVGTTRLLEAVRDSGIKTKFYQASSSEMYGNTKERPQNELTPFSPRSPYAAAKVYAYWMTVNYREAYDMFACNGILFNHESPRRGETFVTRKITMAAARIKHGVQKKLYLGNLNAKRDWGFAGDYCINKDVPILTTDGWKYFDDIQEGQEIINFNPKANRLSRDRVEKKIELESTGNKIVLKGRGVYLNVTPEHRIYYQQKSKTSKGGWSHWKVITAEKFYDLLVNKKVRTRYDYRLPHFQGYNVKDLSGPTDEQLYLMGGLLAEGSFSHSENEGRGLRVGISQSYIANENVFQNIEHAIKKLRLTARERRRNDGVVEWLFNAESSREILSWFDGNGVHVIPRYFYKLSRRQCEIVIRALMDCDGHWGSMVYLTKRYLLAVDFQTIAHLAGYRTTSIKVRSGVGELFEVCLVAKRKQYTYIQEVKKDNDGRTDVWCVQTGHGTIITRDHDCVNISGNCEAMWLMLQQDKPQDYVIATGETHSVKEFLEEAFCHAGLDWKKHVEVDRRYFRPTEVDYLIGDSTKAGKKLKWKPKVGFKELVRMMVEADMALVERELYGQRGKQPNAFLAR